MADHQRLLPSDSDDGEKFEEQNGAHVLSNSISRRRGSQRLLNSQCLLSFAAVFFAVVAALEAGFIFTAAQRQHRGTYESGFNTDLESPRKVIQLEQRPLLSKDDHFYEGGPNPEVDKAWDRLTDGLNIQLGPDEIGKTADETFRFPSDGKYFVGVQVYHTLHCLNRLRQKIHSAYYETLPSSQFYGALSEEHTDHCISLLRNSIMCHADLTPMLWYEGPAGDDDEAGHELHLNQSSLHTCRKWEPIYDWSMKNKMQYVGRAEFATESGPGSYHVSD